VAITTDITYSNAYRADNLGDVKPSILIGGKTEKFVPNVNISFALESSKEQFFLNINRASVTVDKETSSLASEKLALTIGNETDIWHIDENGHLKWDIKFAQKPPTNKLSWALTHTEGLEFYYQPALTQEEIDKGNIRPDNVVGSYAVYCNQSGHYKDADGKTKINYRTGKLLHIYRPLCIDSKGNKEWAELLIEKGTLTITIPQKYLDNAVYPVTLDPTFGNTTLGGSGDSTGGASRLCGIATATPASSGTADSISVGVGFANAGGYLKGVIVDHTNSDVIISNGVANAVSIPEDGWVTSSFGTSPSVSTGTVYYPSFIADISFYVAYDYTGTDYPTDWYGRLDTTNDYSSPANPGSWAVKDIRYSIYCTYTEAGGASPVPLFDYYFNNMRP
jgi:hypothetical protein